MRIIPIILIVIGGLLITLGIQGYLSQDKVTKLTKQEIILECEKLSAIATNDGWSYKSCIENLDGTKTRELTI